MLSAALALLLLPCTAKAQPDAVDLGTLADGPFERLERFYIDTYRWYRFEVPEVDRSRILDIWLNARSPNCSMALYDSTGRRIATDDVEQGVYAFSPALSFGAVLSQRSAVGPEPNFNGRDGVLDAGVYYLVVAVKGSVFDETDWGVEFREGGIGYTLFITSGPASPPIDLGTLEEGVLTVPFIEVRDAAARWFKFTTPATTAADGSYVDLAAVPIGTTGGGGIALYDSLGRLIAGNADYYVSRSRVLSFGAVAPARTVLAYQGLASGEDGDLAEGVYYLAITNQPVTFGASAWDVDVGPWPLRSLTSYDLVLSRGAGDFPTSNDWTETDDAGLSSQSAQAPSGFGELRTIRGRLRVPDAADLFLIDIPDPAAFTATTLGSEPSWIKLFLFDESGHGVTFNARDPGLPGGEHPRITGRHIREPGRYIIAVSSKMPRKSETSPPIWNGWPGEKELRPDGPGAADQVGDWFAGTVPNATYAIRLTGARFPCTQSPPCVADFDRSGGIDGDDIPAFFREWQSGSTCADVDASGGVDGDDVTTFFDAWQAGGC